MQNSESPSPGTLVGLMKAHQTALGLSDHQLSVAVGFEREIVLKLIMAGSMKFPLTKVSALAAALDLDPVELLKLALRESDPGLSKLIEDTFDPMHLTATEQNLVRHLRELSGNTVGAPIVFPGNGIIALVAV